MKAFKSIKVNNRYRLRKLCIDKLYMAKKRKISGRKLKSCKNIEIEREYIEVFGTDPASDMPTLLKYSRSLNLNPEVIIEDTGFIYLIGNIYFGFVKIGYSINPQKRILELQTGCPFKLTVLATFSGTISKEKRLHEKYKAFRSNGEWFRIEGELKRIINNG